MNIKKIKHFTFDYGKKLGEGSTGTVYLGVDTKTNTPVAVKAIELKNIDNEVTQYLLKNEIKALRTTNHPNVLKAIDVIQEPEYVYIVTDYLPNGTLAEYIQKHGSVSEAEALEMFKQIVDGYDHIFDLHIFHRDLKPHNILFDSHFRPVLSDFGYCQMTGYLPKPKLQYNVGSPGFMAPESIVGNLYSENSEVWSLATILYEMMTGRNYTNGKPVMEAVMLIKKQGPYYPQNSSPFTKKLLKDCMMLKPEERLKVKALKKILHDNIKPKPKPAQPNLIPNPFLAFPTNGKSQQEIKIIPSINLEQQKAMQLNQHLKNMKPNDKVNGVIATNNMTNNNANMVPIMNSSQANASISNQQTATVPSLTQIKQIKTVTFHDTQQTAIVQPSNHFYSLNSNPSLPKPSSALNQVIPSINQQDISTPILNSNPTTWNYPNIQSSITNNPFHSSAQHSNQNIIKNLSPRKKARQSLIQPPPPRRNKIFSNSKQFIPEPSNLEMVSSKVENAHILGKNVNQKSVQNLASVFAHQKPIQNVQTLAIPETKEPLKVIQQTAHQLIPQNHLQATNSPVKTPSINIESLKVQNSIEIPLLNNNQFSVHNTNNFPQMMPAAPQAPQQTILNTRNSSKRPMLKSNKSNKSLNTSRHDSQPEYAPFYMPNMLEDSFDYSSKMNNRFMNGNSIQNSQTKSHTQQSVRSRKSIQKQQSGVAVKTIELNSQMLTSKKYQNQMLISQQQQLINAQAKTQQAAQLQLQQQSLTNSHQISLNSQHTISENNEPKILSPPITQSIPNQMNPLPQNIQAPQLNYPLNMLQNQQSLRNSQQIPNQFQIRNSLAQPSMVHPVPQFNSKYSNVIQPNYFGYATGY